MNMTWRPSPCKGKLNGNALSPNTGNALSPNTVELTVKYGKLLVISPSPLAETAEKVRTVDVSPYFSVELMT